MFIFVVPTLQKKWNEIRMKELAGGKCMENDCFVRTLKFEMHYKDSTLINGANKPPNGPNPNLTMQFIKFIYYNDKFSLYKITFKTNKYQLLLDIASVKTTTYIPSTKLIHDTFKIPKLNIKSYLSNNSKP
jgi:hypothetical protein